jgi:hypothetical protein
MNSSSFKPTLAAAAPAFALFLLVQACGGSGAAVAQEAPDPAEGVWEATVSVKDCTSGNVLATFRGSQVFHRGGTLTDTNSAPSATRGPGFGVWARSGASYTSKFRFYTYDATGAISGITRVTRTFTIAADGKSKTGTNTNQTEDLAGTVIRTGCGTDASTRVL